MRKINHTLMLWLFMALALPILAGETEKASENHLKPIDVFNLEYASDPQISPDGYKIVYVRNFFDIMTDRARSNLWIINFDGSDHRPLTSGNQNYSSPRWSPDGSKLLYVSGSDGSSQIYLRWMDTGQTAKLTNLTQSPSGLSWSADGKWIAFSMMVKAEKEPFVKMPPKPEGADWAKPARVIEKLRYRADGEGYLEDGYTQLFTLPVDGGTPRQITSGDFNHGGAPSWTPNSKTLLFSANRHDNWEFEPLNSEIYQVSLADGAIKALTDRNGPDTNPVVSADGKKIAYLGFDDQLHGYHVTKLYVMNRDGSNSKLISADLDRRVARPEWSGDGKGIYFQYDDRGNTKIGYASLTGTTQTVTGDVGGLSLGRPYAGGVYSISKKGRFAFTHSRPDHPADVAVGKKGSASQRITKLNDDLLSHKKLGAVEEIWYESSHDGRKIQGWIVKPPNFDPQKKYPLLLEIHGGPFANYGDRFSAECQLYAAAGYVVLYTNPRGSSGYGKKFGNAIKNNYPGPDYDDLMAGVDEVLKRGYIDKQNLFVCGGSGGGVLTSWIVGHTERFTAAVVMKPVTNWFSFVGTTDGSSWYRNFKKLPWEDPAEHLRRSSLMYVGNVTTPTLLLTGENDLRTPMEQTEQYYQALRLRKVETAMVRIQDEYHGIGRTHPTNKIRQILYLREWFEKYKKTDALTKK